MRIIARWFPNILLAVTVGLTLGWLWLLRDGYWLVPLISDHSAAIVKPLGINQPERVVVILPNLGWLLTALQNMLVRIGLIYLPCSAVIYKEIQKVLD